MNARSMIKAACLAAFLAAACAAAADEAATPPPGVDMMGHSPASKEHIKMQQAPAGDAAAEAPSAPSNGMGHSPASKEHTMMNRTPAAGSGASDDCEHMMMDHSPADAKAMSKMKDKHPKTHKCHKDAKPAQ